MYLLRFDLRAPDATGPERSARHRTAVEMARHVDQRGCASIVISEHHAASDGYLSSPFMLAAAIAAATTSTPIVVAVALLPLYDPVRLAEDIITLDHMSGGRAIVVLGVGYRPVEYELYGVDFTRRGRIADEKLARLLELLHDAASSEDPQRVTPRPFTMPIPMLAWGGGSVAAARRAGRNGLGFFAQTNTEGLREAYESSAREAGHEPGVCVLPSPEAPYAVFVNDDLDAGWAEVGPSLLADATAYHQWNVAAGLDVGTASLSSASTLEALRADPTGHRVVTTDQARQLVAEFGILSLHPLCGGLDPDAAWRYLESAIDAVGRTNAESTDDP